VLFAWQTAIGRQPDAARGSVEAGIRDESLCDLTQGDAYLRDGVCQLCEWMDEACAKHGFKIWGACVETNGDRGPAGVHLHAYVCQGWKARGTPDWGTANFNPSDWKYQGYESFPRVSTLRGNACAKKLLTQGLYYAQAMKVGAVFSGGNVAAGKVPATQANIHIQRFPRHVSRAKRCGPPRVCLNTCVVLHRNFSPIKGS
jgi:hypothetical protein